MTGLYLGMDGGGSKTMAVVVDSEGCEVARGMAGSSNYTGVGLEQAAANVSAAVRQAVEAAGGQLPVAAGWFGLAGVDRPADFERWRLLLAHLAGAFQVTNDGELPLTALPRAVGVSVIAGTGSIVIGRDATGKRVRVGGWGHIIGDEGSGYDLGRSALQAASQAADGRGPGTSLLDAILSLWHLGSADDIIACVYSDNPKTVVASLAPVVLEQAEVGDEVATSIVERGADDLARATVAVGTRLSFPDGVPLALSGGLLVGTVRYRERVLADIQECGLRLGQVAVVPDAASSAARAARDLAGVVS